MAPPLSLFAPCAPGLEPLLREELRNLGGATPQVEKGGVGFRGTLETLYRANLHSGLALSVHWRVARFAAHDFRELDKRLARLEWEQWLRPDVPVELRVHSKGSRLYHTGAIEDRVRKVLPTTHDANGEPVRLVVRVTRQRCTIAIDTSGTSLHKRGYRTQPGRAPLREDLARALLTVAGYDGTQPLWDPLCGSGTLPIEAALIATRRAPGAQRRFAFQRLAGADDALWTRLLQQAAAEVRDPRAAIVGSDRDERSVEAARGNSERAGLAENVQWQTAALSEAQPGPHRDGLLVTNPPYGKRLGNERALRALYAGLGRRVRQLPGDWRTALVTPSAKLAGSTGLDLQSALLTDAGGLKVRLYTSKAAHG